MTHQPTLNLCGGFDAGPLFAPPVKRAAPKRRPGTTDHGRIRRRAELRATPLWVDRRAVREMFKQAEKLTRDTGVMHSVDHLVPLQHPLVCGLHCEANMRVSLLSDNMRKGNREWPGMWGAQDDFLSLVTEDCHR